MTCPHCNAPLAPGSGFCGSCGQRVHAAQPQPQPWQQPQGQPQQWQQPPQQQGWQPPQQAQQPQQQWQQPPQQQQWQQPGQQQPWQQPPPQGQQPPPQQWQQPGQPPQQWQQPGQPPPQQWPQPNHPPPPAPGGVGFVMRPYPLVMQQRLTRLTGQMFLAPNRLFFLCESQKGGLGVALGQGIGGLVGGVIAAAMAPVPGQAAPVVDEPMLFQAVQQMPGSMVMEPPQFKAIKHTMWTRGIFYGGKTYALPNGLDKELRTELGRWCQANNVRQAGLIK